VGTGNVTPGFEGRKYVLLFKSSLRAVRPLFVCLSLVFAVVGALGILFSVISPAQAQIGPCENIESLDVPGAEEEPPNNQKKFCLPDLTTKTLEEDVTTDRQDWENGIISLHSARTVNPPELVPGIQINGCFPDNSENNDNTSCDHDSQFAIRLPNEWNGKLVITGTSGNRQQYGNDFIFSDYFVARGYAYAVIDKGNTDNAFFEDGKRPGDAVLEWHRRVAQLTVATKDTVKQRYGKAPERTYITGISNGGYLTRYALENTPELYDGGVDWEGTLFRERGPNLFTYLPVALRNYPECQATGFDEDARPCQRMYEAGYEKGSEFLWPQHYLIFWDLTQRIFREEFDPRYDGDTKAGTPFCQDETSPPPPCDADYRYGKRPERVKNAVGRVSLTGKIGKPMITLHGTLDALLPIDTDSNPYRRLIEKAGKADLHRYYKIDKGNHVDRFYDEAPENPIPNSEEELRPILPCHRAAFEELEEWVEYGDPTPSSRLVEKEESDDPLTDDEVNFCSIDGDNGEATYSGPTDTP
jgi:predicted esterase